METNMDTRGAAGPEGRNPIKGDFSGQSGIRDAQGFLHMVIQRFDELQGRLEATERLLEKTARKLREAERVAIDLAEERDSLLADLLKASVARS